MMRKYSIYIFFVYTLYRFNVMIFQVSMRDFKSYLFNHSGSHKSTVSGQWLLIMLSAVYHLRDDWTVYCLCVIFFSCCFIYIIERRHGKNPDVDTSFLPDKDREVCALIYQFSSNNRFVHIYNWNIVPV